MILKGEVVLRAGVMNRNNRIYSQDVLNKLNLQLQEKIANYAVFGEFSDSGRAPEYLDTQLNRVSHRIENSVVDGTDLKVDVRILETPAGKILRDMLTSTPKSFVFRPRMAGHVGPAGNVVECTVFAVDAISAPNDSFLGII